MESTSSLPSDSDISPQLRPLGTSPPHAGCFRAKVRDCPCVSASPGLLSRTARGAAAPPRSPAGLCLEARAGWPHLLPVGQVPGKLAVSGVLCDASRRHTFAVLQPSCSAPYCTRHRAAERGAEMGAGVQVFSPNFLLTSLHLSLFLSLRDGLTWRPASPEGMRALQ